MAEQYSIVYMYHSFLIHSSADGHLGCFHVLAIINSAAISGFFIVQLSHPYTTTGKTIGLTRQTLVGINEAYLTRIFSKGNITLFLYLGTLDSTSVLCFHAILRSRITNEKHKNKEIIAQNR